MRQNTNKEPTIKDFMKPLNFDLVVSFTKEMTGFSQTNEDGELLLSFQIPSLPLKILLYIIINFHVPERNRSANQRFAVD